MLDRGLALCRAADNRDTGRATAAALGFASALAGRLAEGRALLEGRRSGGLNGQSRYVAQLSAVCLLAGRIDEACQHAGQALALARQYGERGNEALALYQLGAVHAQADPPEVVQSEARYREALPWPRHSACARSRALPPWPRYPVCRGRTAGAGPGRTVCRHDAVLRYGHDLLGIPGGDGPGAGRRGDRSRDGKSVQLGIAMLGRKTILGAASGRGDASVGAIAHSAKMYS